MKRILNIVALGAIILVGLGTYAVSGKQNSNDWSLRIDSNEALWENRSVRIGHVHMNQSNQEIDVSKDRSRVVNGNYIDEVIQYRKHFREKNRTFARTMNQLDYAHYIKTEDGYVAVGQEGRDTLVLLQSKDGKTVDRTEFSQARSVLESEWNGIFVYNDNVYLVYNENYETTNQHVAILHPAEKTIETKKIDRNGALIGSVIGRSWGYEIDNNLQSIVATNRRYIPIQAIRLLTMESDNDSYSVEDVFPGLYVYDIEENRVVSLEVDEYTEASLVSGDTYRSLLTDGREITIDLRTLDKTSRKVIQGKIGTANYYNDLLYHVYPTQEGAEIDVYEGEQIVSHASLTGRENNESLWYYVY